MTIDKNKIYFIEDDAMFRNKLFELMINQDDYPFGEFIMEIYYQGWAFLIYRESDGSLAMAYHKEQECRKNKYFMSMGGLCHLMLKQCLNIDPKVLNS